MRPGVEARGARKIEAALRQFRRGDRAVEVVEERGRGEVAAGDALGQADGPVEGLAGEVHRSVGLGDTDGELGMAGVEAGEARDQPLHGQSAHAGDVQLAVRGGAHLAERLLQLVEGAAERAGQPFAGVGQLQRVARALGQLDAAERLQTPHLAADRPMGDAELVGRQAHLAEPREGLEGPKGRQRKLAALGHVISAHEGPRYSAAGSAAVAAAHLALRLAQ